MQVHAAQSTPCDEIVFVAKRREATMRTRTSDRREATIFKARCLQLMALLLGMLVVHDAALAAESDRKIVRQTKVGREVELRGFIEYDGQCKPRNIPTITIVDAPAHGTVEQRPGVVTIGDNWVGNQNCAGTRLDGIQVYYKPADGFAGTDHLSFDVAYQRHPRVHAVVDVEVR
jgi:hypothetical protein